MINKKIIYILSVFLILFYTFPLAIGYIGVKGALFLIFPLIALIYNPKSFLNKQSFWFLIGVAIWVTVLSFRGEYERLSWLSSFIFYWLNCLCLSNIYIYNNQGIYLKKINQYVFLSILISLLMSLPMLISDPMFIRETLAASFYNIADSKENLLEMQKKGMVEYTFIHSIPSFFPLFFVLNKTSNNKKIKLWSIVMIILFYFFVLKTNFGTVIILSTIVIMMCIITSKNKRKNIFRFSIVAIIGVLFLNENFLISSLESVIPLFDNTIMVDKINDIIVSLTSASRIGQLDTRGSLYDESWNAFFKSPMIGGGGVVGEHSMLADFLAWFGIIGTIPLLLFLFNLLKTAYNKINKKYRLFYLFSILPYLVLMILKGTSGFMQLYVICVFIPGIFILINSNKFRYNENK